MLHRVVICKYISFILPKRYHTFGYRANNFFKYICLTRAKYVLS